MGLDVSYQPSGLSPLRIYWGRICCIYYYFLVLSTDLLWTWSFGTPPPSRPFRLTQQWVGVHNWIPHPPLWFVPWFTVITLNFIVIPNYNDIECFWSTLIYKGLYRVIESLYVFLEHRPFLVIKQNGFHYLHGGKLWYILHFCPCLGLYGSHEVVVIFL